METQATTAEDYASRLLALRRAGRTFTSVFDGGEVPGVDFAYAIQKHVVAALDRGGGRAGYKVGLTSPRMQAMCGVGEPITGVVLNQRMHRSPATVAAADFIRLGLECEVAVRIGPHFPGDDPAGLGLEDVPQHLDAVSAAFELIDDAAADYGRLKAATLVADNGWNAGLVIGESVAPSSVADFTELEGVLRLDGEAVEKGVSRDVLGNPLNVVLWLARELLKRGGRLAAGDWVSTGSIVPTRFVKPGERYVFTLGRLPPVELAIG
jgi:2-keto-4-pentenoate hydratase